MGVISHTLQRDTVPNIMTDGGPPDHQKIPGVSRTEIMQDMLVGAAPDECILWPYVENQGGYGYIQVDGKKWTAHRYALYLHTGINPGDKVACHEPIICHNRACINPHHLRWDTQKNNIADKAIDNTKSIGERNGQSKLKEADIPLIRKDPRKLQEIALDYNVSFSLIGLIKARKSWEWVPEDDEISKAAS